MKETKKVIVYTDGGSRGNPGVAGLGVYITDKKGGVIKEISKPLGIQTNNYAEYEAIIEALEGLKKIYGKEKLSKMLIDLRSDSELIVKQLNGEYQIKEETLFPKFIKIWNLKITTFPNITFTHVLRDNNKEADRLANKAMDENGE